MSSLVQNALRTAFQELERPPRQGIACPYPCHLLSCVQIVASAGGGEDTQAAAALHEMVEEVRWPIDRVVTEFGHPVADLVAQVSEDIRLPWRQRKQEVCDLAGRCGQTAGLVLLADKLDTLLALARSQHGSPGYWNQFHAGFADQLWFHQELVRALRSNRRLRYDLEDPGLRTGLLIQELTAALDRFRQGRVWTPDGVRPGTLEEVC
jgi:(p)ppGpp synthase/HD superfamily hydrolase